MNFDHPANLWRSMKRHRWPDTSARLSSSAALQSGRAKVVWFTASSRLRSPAVRWKSFLSVVSQEGSASK
jgi:hypothetical protein